MKKLDPDEASLNEHGLIISHLPSGPRPLVKEKKKNPCSKPELFTIDRKNGWWHLSTVHTYIRNSCSNVLSTKKQLCDSTSSPSTLGQKMFQVTSVDSIAYQLYWKYQRRIDREKERAEEIKRGEENRPITVKNDCFVQWGCPFTQQNCEYYQ